MGHIIDIVSVIATILGVSVTLGYGVSQFAAGLFNITGMGWLMDAEGTPTAVAMIFCLVIVMIFSTLSALSSVGKGIKCLSNINMGLSLFILAFFLVFGLTMFSFRALFLGMWDYVIALPAMSLTVFSGDGIEDSVATKLAGWQGG